MPQSNYLKVGSMTAIGWCTLCIGIIGLSVLIGGAILTGISYTEIRPNTADKNYDRFLGANVKRIVGPIMLAFGGILLIGGCIFFAFAFYFANREYREKTITYSADDRKAPF